MTAILIKICGLIACFIFASGFAAGAAKSFDEKKWSDFGLNLTLCLSFWTGVVMILQMWCGIV